MAAASSSAIGGGGVSDLDDDLPSDILGQNESSDPDFDPASQAETLLMSLHDRMIISMIHPRFRCLSSSTSKAKEMSAPYHIEQYQETRIWTVYNKKTIIACFIHSDGHQ